MKLYVRERACVKCWRTLQETVRPYSFLQGAKPSIEDTDTERNPLRGA